MHDFPVTEEFVNTVNVVQFNDEVRGDREEWPASFTRPDDSTGWVYRVELEDDELDDDAIQEAIEAHVPDPDYGTDPDVVALRQYRNKSSVTAAETAAALKKLLDRMMPEVRPPEPTPEPE